MDAAGHAEDLADRDTPAVGGGDETLRDHAAQRACKHRAHLLVVVGSEELEHAVDRLPRIEGVDRREHEVAGLRRRHRGLDGFLVAHLTDQDHVGVLSQHAPQRVLERDGVDADLALADHRAAIAVDELDRVFDRDDVRGTVDVDVMDHRRQRRRLARAGRAGHEDDPALLLRHAGHDGRQRQLFDRADAVGNGTRYERDTAALLARIDPKPRDVGDLARDVDLVALLELVMPHALAQHLVQHLLCVAGLKRRPLLAAQRRELAVDASHRDRAGLQVQIGSVASDERAQCQVNVDHS